MLLKWRKKMEDEEEKMNPGSLGRATRSMLKEPFVAEVNTLFFNAVKKHETTIILLT